MIIGGCGGVPSDIPDNGKTDWIDEEIYNEIKTTFDEGSDFLVQSLNEGESKEQSIQSVVEWFKEQENVKDAFIWSKDDKTVQVDFKSGLSKLLMVYGSGYTNQKQITSSKWNATFNKNITIKQLIKNNFKIKQLENKKAVIMSPFHDTFNDDYEYIGKLLNNCGFSVEFKIDEDVTVDFIRTLANYGVIHWNTHGNFKTLATGERVTDNKNEYYKEMIDSNYLWIVTHLFEKLLFWEKEDETYDIDLSFISEFIEQFPNSFIYLDACDSLKFEGYYLGNAFKDNGAGVILGWTDTVNNEIVNYTTPKIYEYLINDGMTVSQAIYARPDDPKYAYDEEYGALLWWYPDSAQNFTFIDEPPPTPTGLNAVPVGTSNISLTWDEVANATSYNIYRSNSINGTYSYIDWAVSNSYTDSGLFAGTTYYYKISAINAYGESPLSDYALATTESSNGVDNQAPQVSNGEVSPTSGDTSTDFTYSVYYYDADGDSPAISYVNIDGTDYSMSLSSGYSADGTYFYTTHLSAGSHNYYFIFSDGKQEIKFPGTGSYSGP
ncbi:MAG: fibronectin type III domain-containing protein, partial [Candidatus Heimdallarchaeaceae archaeon]